MKRDPGDRSDPGAVPVESKNQNTKTLGMVSSSGCVHVGHVEQCVTAHAFSWAVSITECTEEVQHGIAFQTCDAPIARSVVQETQLCSESQYQVTKRSLCHQSGNKGTLKKDRTDLLNLATVHPLACTETQRNAQLT